MVMEWKTLENELEQALRAVWAELATRGTRVCGFGVCLPESSEGIELFVHTRETVEKVIADSGLGVSFRRTTRRSIRCEAL